MKLKIKSLSARTIFDSRGEPTVEITACSKKHCASASVPSGKSVGRMEAAVVSAGEAAPVLEKVSEAVRGHSFASLRALDDVMRRADGTERKSKFGGNIMLGVSVAAARLMSIEKEIPLWKFLKNGFFSHHTHKQAPLIFSNFINGGVHAPNNLDIQEYMVIMRVNNSYADSIEKLAHLYRRVYDAISASSGTRAIPLGDEGGYAANFRGNFEPVEIIEQCIRAARLESVCSIGLDAAATSFFENGEYVFEGERLSPSALQNKYEEYFKKSKLLLSIEDPFAENDAEAFAGLRGALGLGWVIGDDLTATNPRLIEQYAGINAISGVIIKPNQIGTVSETCDALNAAKSNGLDTIVSHRSGETEDTFIIELAKAASADAVKIGAPARERMAKFNELIRLYD